MTEGQQQEYTKIKNKNKNKNEKNSLFQIIGHGNKWKAQKR